MEEQNYKDDLKDIRDMMNRSSRFISLSGWSGVSAGITALLGAYSAYSLVFKSQDYLDSYKTILITSEDITTLIIIALVTLLAAIGFGLLFTTIQARRNHEKLWDLQTKRLIINLALPLITGGILCLILIARGYIGIIAPLTLIFYGLALVNASKYTLSEIRGLGIAEIILGLFSAYFVGFGLIAWAVGFGLLHIIYGIVMQLKYGS